MDIRGITYDQMLAAVAAVSPEYDGNVEIHQDAKPLTQGVRGPNGFRGRIRVKSSREAGARRSWSGRRTVSACWHVHRDIMVEVFNLNPSARISTSLADYRGREDFLNKYPGTAHHNIGSMMTPAYMPELCDC